MMLDIVFCQIEDALCQQEECMFIDDIEECAFRVQCGSIDADMESIGIRSFPCFPEDILVMECHRDDTFIWSHEILFLALEIVFRYTQIRCMLMCEQIPA